MRSCTVHILTCICVFITSWFALKDSISAFHLHILFCVIGYQLLISNGINCLHGDRWFISRLKNRRRMHWILQTLGTIFAILGSCIMINQKTVNFTSIHGKLALAALILTLFSIFNGVTSLCNAFHRFPFVKYSHLCCGTSAFVISSICLCFGFTKESFIRWSSEFTAYILILLVVVYTSIIVRKPYSNVWKGLNNKTNVKLHRNLISYSG